MGKLLPFMKFLEKEAGFKFDIEKFGGVSSSVKIHLQQI